MPTTDTQSRDTTPARRSHRLARQGALLFSGFAAAQAFSFARNALIGHALSKGHFGIAATITLFLQLLESLSDLGADRLLIQAEDGDGETLIAAAHTTLLARGVLSALILLAAAGPAATFFGIETARWAFEVAAVVPLLKGAMHLDARRFQRRLDNRAQLLVEVAPQGATMLATPLALHLEPSYAVVVWLALLQAGLAVAISHAVAERPYRASLDREALGRLLAFGWPIWASAIPLIAVYHADRMIVGRLYGIEALAGYTAAFMVTMVPGLVAAKVGHSLILPALAGVRSDAARYTGSFKLAVEVTTLVAALYLGGFLIAGGAVPKLAFGTQYDGLAPLVAALAAMWAVRMVQAVPGMALMAHGETRPLLVAGTLRALALGPAALVALSGGELWMVAACGLAGEIASLVYLAARCERHGDGHAGILLRRTLFLVPAGAAAGAVATLLAPGQPLALTASLAITCATIAVGGLLAMPQLRSRARGPGGEIAGASVAPARS